MSLVNDLRSLAKGEPIEGDLCRGEDGKFESCGITSDHADVAAAKKVITRVSGVRDALKERFNLPSTKVSLKNEDEVVPPDRTTAKESFGYYDQNNEEIVLASSDKFSNQKQGLTVGGKGVDLSLEGIYRHETGHALYSRFPRVRKIDWEDIHEGVKETKLSSVASQNSEEYFSEAFSLYTSADYKDGMLPKPVVSFFSEMEKPKLQKFFRVRDIVEAFKKAKITKAEGDPSRPSCIHCVQKHLGAAQILLAEVNDGYPHRLMLIGHLEQAEEEAQEWEDLHVAIREARKGYQEEDEVPDFEKLGKLTEEIRLKKANDCHDPETGEFCGDSSFPKAGATVDGRTVRKGVPNQGSIEASLSDYEILPGIREVKMSDFPAYKDPYKKGQPLHYNAREHDRTINLAEQIKESKEISPLIVVIDKDGPYVLEGGHRVDALWSLGAKSFPAMVVKDLESLQKNCGIGEGGFQEGNSCAHGGERIDPKLSKDPIDVLDEPLNSKTGRGKLPKDPEKADWSLGAIDIFHATSVDNIESIEKNGLKTNRGTTQNVQGFASDHDAVYSHPTEDVAVNDARRADESSGEQGSFKVVMARVPVASIKSFLVKDEDTGKDPKTVYDVVKESFGVRVDIPPGYIIKVGNNWKPSFNKMEDIPVINHGSVLDMFKALTKNCGQDADGKFGEGNSCQRSGRSVSLDHKTKMSKTDQTKWQKGISKEDTEALNGYATANYTEINARLRGNKKALENMKRNGKLMNEKSAKDQTERISKLIEKAGKFEKSVSVFKGTRSKKIYETLKKQVGKTVTLNGFQSTSTRFGVADQFTRVGSVHLGTIIEIETDKGLYRGGFGPNKNEDEVLLGHGWKYEVVEVGELTIDVLDEKRPYVKLRVK